MKIGKWGAIALLGYSLVALSGCSTFLQKEAIPKTENTLGPASVLRFTDIPVPAGFRLSQEDSYSFENTGMRVAVLRYQGKADIEKVVNFYKDQMAMYNWNFLNIIEYGERLLNFERDNETCIISLLPKGSSVTISISLGPKSPGLAKKPREPIK